MSTRSNILLILTSITSFSAYTMEDDKGPMDDAWFYGDHFYSQVNKQFLQKRRWKDAEAIYIALLAATKDTGHEVDTEYDQDMARLNLASAQMAQRKASRHWKVFDRLCGIAPEKRYTKDVARAAEGPLVIHSDKVGIGDIAHFLPVIKIAKKCWVSDVRLALRGFMHKALEGPSKEYDFTLVHEKEADAQPGYHTHLIALYGLLNVRPTDLKEERAIYTTTERALEKIRACLAPHEDKALAVLFLGEDRAATLIGGKRLPYDAKEHGRCLDAQEFAELLKEHENLCLIDCNPEKSRITFDPSDSTHLAMSAAYEKRVIPLPKEDDPFDSVIALGLIMNKEEDMVGFAGDNGPPNLFVRTLTKGGQQRMAFIIPNGQEYDMRMEGEGSCYTQMLSHCRVYRCETPKEQTEVIKKAYEDMTEPADSTSKEASSCGIL